MGRQALHCIRCSACLNICPVYERVGGHAYNATYPGPIGSILTPQLLGPGVHDSLPFASTLCGACPEVCPVEIEIPKVLLHLRARVSEGGRSPLRRPSLAPRPLVSVERGDPASERVPHGYPVDSFSALPGPTGWGFRAARVLQRSASTGRVDPDSSGSTERAGSWRRDLPALPDGELSGVVRRGKVSPEPAVP